MSESEALQLGLSLGANELGTLISSVFLGITTVQLYMYYKNDFKDARWIRLMVSVRSTKISFSNLFEKVSTIWYLLLACVLTPNS